MPDLLVIAKNVGYELRCHPPNPFDKEYTRLLGYGAVKFLLSGGSNAMITRVGASLSPVPFSNFINCESKKSAIRMVDTKSTYYRMARSYQIRLTLKDLADRDFVLKFAKLIDKSEDYVIERFSPIAKEWGEIE